MTRDEYVAAIKSAAISIGKNAVMTKLVAQLPFLGMSFVNPIVAWVVGLIVTYAIEQTEMGIFFEYVDMRVSGQKGKFEDAALAYDKAKQSGDKNEISLREEDLKKAFADFVSYRS